MSDPADAPHSLPGSFYRDSESLRRLEQWLFPRSWQWLPTWDPALAPGHWQAIDLLPGCLAEPLLQSCDEAGQHYLLSNSCTHRGARLCPSQGAGRHLRCPYHGRRFALDGSLVAAPGFEGVDDFPTARDDLPKPSFATWGPLAFLRLVGQETFATWSQPFHHRLAFLPWHRLCEDPAGRRCHEVAAHWSLYVENYLEGFHIPFVHPALARALDLEHYRHEEFAQATLQLGIANDHSDAVFDLPPGHADHGHRIAAYYFWMWPNLMLNVYPWGLSANLVEPVDATACRVHYRRFRFPGMALSGAGQDLDQVEKEDQAIVTEVQAGVRSHLFHGGRLALQHEAGVALFHRLLGAAAEQVAAD